MTESNNFFELIEWFKKNVDWLNLVLIGGEADSALIDGVEKPSIDKRFADRFAELQAMVQGRNAFETKAALLASGAPPPEKPLAEVWNDQTLGNNGLYGYITGTGWTKSPYDTAPLDSYDRLSKRSITNSAIDTKLADLKQFVGHAAWSPANYYSGGSGYIWWKTPTIYIRGPYYKTAAWASLVDGSETDGSLVFEDYDGQTDCLKMGHLDTLIYDSDDGLFKIVPRDDMQGTNQHIICRSQDSGMSGGIDEHMQAFKAHYAIDKAMNDLSVLIGNVGIDTRAAWTHLCPITTSHSGVPEVNTETKTLTIPDDTLIYFDGTWRSVPATVIDLEETTTSSAKRVFYRPQSQDFTTIAYGVTLNSAQRTDWVLVATMRLGTSETTNISISCPCKVDGFYPGGDLMNPGGTIAMIHTPLNNVAASRNEPNYSTEDKTLTFFSDTIFHALDRRWVLAEDEIVSIDTSVSSAWKIYWDTENNTLRPINWAANLSSRQYLTHVLVATIRHSYTTNPVISITCPYKINGFLFGQTFATEGTRLKVHQSFIAHRGLHVGCPENSLDAYRFAGRCGFYMGETDIGKTSDGQYVLMHDDTLDRTCEYINGDPITGGVRLDSVSFSELRANYRLKHTSAKYRQPIPTLSEWLAVCRDYNVVPMIEIKTGSGMTNADVEAIIDIANGIVGPGKYTLTSFSQAFLDHARMYDTECWLHYILFPSVDHVAERAPSAIYPSYDSLTQSLVDECRRKKVTVSCWTVPVSNVSELVRMGVDQISADVVCPEPGRSVEHNATSDNDFVGWSGGVITGAGLELLDGEIATLSFGSDYYLGGIIADLWVQGGATITMAGHATTIIDTGMIEAHRWHAMLYPGRSASVSITASGNVTLQSAQVIVERY